MPAVRTIARVSAIGSAEFEGRYASPEVPVIVEGAIASWRATTRWTPTYLKELLGETEIRYKVSESAAHPDFHQASLGKMFARASGRFDEFIDFITSGPEEERARRLFTGDEQFILQRRRGKTTVAEGLKPLFDDVDIPALVPKERLYTVWGWFSGAGVRTWLHYDNNGCHNLNAQITGRKSCLLYPPSELAKLYPFELGGTNPAHNCSRIDVDAPDFQEFADFREVESWSGELGPGDLLFIPAYWFHTFRHEGEFNSNVNFWWKPERPRMNAVAARQAMLDAVASANIDVRSSADVLRSLDMALTRPA